MTSEGRHDFRDCHGAALELLALPARLGDVRASDGAWVRELVQDLVRRICGERSAASVSFRGASIGLDVDEASRDWLVRFLETARGEVPEP